MSILYNIWGLRKLALLGQNLAFNILYKKKLGNKISIFGVPTFSIAKYSEIKVGTNLVLISDSYFSEPGINHRVIIRTLSPNARIIIGNNVGISGGGICAAEQVTIGNNVMIGANSFITDTDFHPIKPYNRRFIRDAVVSKKVVIQDNVLIGMDSLILKGVTIGENSVIGARSVVTKDIPANCVAAGIPARVIKVIV
jgi:acetyltransferase-like isoleucine patch superfamily enzyme